MRLKFLFILSVMYAATLTGFAQTNRAAAVLSVDSIMQDKTHWFRHLPDDLQWSADGDCLFFSWQGPEDSVKNTYKYQPRKGELSVATAQEKEGLLPRRVAWSANKEKAVYEKKGSLWLLMGKMHQPKPLLKDVGAIRAPHFVTDTKVAFLLQEDLYTLDLNSRVVSKVLDFREGAKPTNAKAKKASSWLTKQQEDLFIAFEENNGTQEEQDEEVPVVYLQDYHLGSVRMAEADGIVSYQLYKRGDRKYTKVPYYVERSGYTEIRNARPKVGTAAPSELLVGIYHKDPDTTYLVNADSIPGIFDYPAYYKEYDRQAPDEPRKVNTYGPYWSPDGKHAVLDIRSLDNKDRWIMKLNPQSGELTLLDRQRDEAWIGGPGMRAYGGGSVHWMPDSKHIWFRSEVTGYAHLYTMNIETLKKEAITSGTFEIYDPTLSADGNFWYYHTNEAHTGERHFYRHRVGTNKREKLTTGVGQHEVVVSPNDKWLAIRYSNATQPWELYVKPNKSNAVAEKVTHSTSESFESHNWLTPDYVTFMASDGKQVPARLYMPKHPNGAAVMFVHGAGYLQNAHKGWSKYFREYMFHNFLVQQGYTVLDVDYRGSAGYGRDWRTAIYRHMGGRDLQDYVDGAKWLVDQHQIDKERIGIYGGSYGGFITLMALFTEAETFAAGAALRSVTDWAHYNHSYTSNILNTPVLDSIAYHRSSPINFAEGLADPLLMCHGMVDMNVHFQDIVRLSQRLIDLGKEDWELAVYPLERHSFTEPESWTDEYKRIWKLFNTHLGTNGKDNLSGN